MLCLVCFCYFAFEIHNSINEYFRSYKKYMNGNYEKIIKYKSLYKKIKI